MDRWRIAVFFALLAGFSLLANFGAPSAAHAIGDTLTVSMSNPLNIKAVRRAFDYRRNLQLVDALVGNRGHGARGSGL